MDFQLFPLLTNDVQKSILQLLIVYVYKTTLTVGLLFIAQLVRLADERRD